MTHFTWVIRVLLSCKGADFFQECHFLKKIFFFFFLFFSVCRHQKIEVNSTDQSVQGYPKTGIKPLMLLFVEIFHFIHLSILLLSQVLRLRHFSVFPLCIRAENLSNHQSSGKGANHCGDLLSALTRKTV